MTSLQVVKILHKRVIKESHTYSQILLKKEDQLWNWAKFVKQFISDDL